MKLIYRLARWVPRLLPDGRRLRPTEVVREYEKTLIDELNLLRESANAIQLRRNFEGSRCSTSRKSIPITVAKI